MQHMTDKGRILAAIEKGARTPGEIARAARIKPISVPPRLSDLFRMGVLDRERNKTGKVGRPQFSYSIKEVA